MCVTSPTMAGLESGSCVSLTALASGDFCEITVAATVTATSGSVTNVATIAALFVTADSGMPNRNATEVQTCTLPTYLAITKTDGVGVTSVLAGGSTTYTV